MSKPPAKSESPPGMDTSRPERQGREPDPVCRICGQTYRPKAAIAQFKLIRDPLTGTVAREHPECRAAVQFVARPRPGTPRQALRQPSLEPPPEPASEEPRP